MKRRHDRHLHSASYARVEQIAAVAVRVDNVRALTLKYCAHTAAFLEVVPWRNAHDLHLHPSPLQRRNKRMMFDFKVDHGNDQYPMSVSMVTYG